MWHYQHSSSLTKCDIINIPRVYQNVTLSTFLVIIKMWKQFNEFSFISWRLSAFYLMVGLGEEQEYRYVLYDEDKAEYTDYQVK